MKKNIKTSYFFGKVFVFVVIFMSVVAICGNIITLNAQNEKMAKLEETKNTLRIKEEELQKLIDEPVDFSYIERIMMEKFDYGRPYGTLFRNGLFD